MAQVEVGQVWEVYSATEGQWVPVTVAKVDGNTVTLRYQGVFEFITADVADLQDKPDVFRRVELDTRSDKTP